ncbi:MAG TPA: hypothetical protein VHT28_13950 [Silvibacterium sp.]|nr:hypothetical protein [Silvibacterium sp.]
MPALPPELINQVSGLVAQYITAQRERYAPAAVPLSALQRSALQGFFTAEVLDNTRVLILRGERVANPEFYPLLQSYGLVDLPDQSAMDAITYLDTVVSHVNFTDGLLFHELVHVEQYRQLGIIRFADLYVRGFLNGGGYFGIPLERNAYLLGNQYEANSAQRFSVAEDVARWTGEGRF